MKKFNRSGNRRQSSVIDATNDLSMARVRNGFHHGAIVDVYTIDNPKNMGVPFGVYTLYSVRLAPSGQIVRNVPALSFGGHFLSSTVSAWNNLPNYGVTSEVSAPSNSIQNVEETPYVINQPVLVGFLQDKDVNPIILGPAPCIEGGSGQTTSEYPKKYGFFQGTSWSIDKSGAVELDVTNGQNLTIKVAGNTLCYITNGVVNLGGSSAADTTVLGPALMTYLNTTLKGWIDNHMHTSASAGSQTSTPTTAPATPDPFPTASGIETTIVKVL